MQLAQPYIKPTYLQKLTTALGDGVVLPLNPRAPAGVIQIDGGGATAGETLTLTGQPLNTETVRVGLEIYTFLTVLVAGKNNVLIGLTASASIDNLIAAILAQEGEGTLWGVGTVENVYATAAAGAGDTMDASAKTPGVAGNAIVCTETLTNGSWAAGTFSGGTAFVGTVEPMVSLDDTLWTPPAATPIGGGAAVTTMTGVGMWSIATEGRALLWCPITAYTSGTINVRFLHTPAFKG